MTFWDFLDQNQWWAVVLFFVIYCLLDYLEGLKKRHDEKNPKWEKIK